MLFLVFVVVTVSACQAEIIVYVLTISTIYALCTTIYRSH